LNKYSTLHSFYYFFRNRSVLWRRTDIVIFNSLQGAYHISDICSCFNVGKISLCSRNSSLLDCSKSKRVLHKVWGDRANYACSQY